MNPSKLSRREFIKIASLGTALSATLAGYTAFEQVVDERFPASRLDFQPGANSQTATTCTACPAGCGLIVHTWNGWMCAIQGNPEHPVRRGFICQRSQAMLRALYHPERVAAPQRQPGRDRRGCQRLEWPAATAIVADTLKKYAPGQIAFLIGSSPGHLYDLAQLLSQNLGGINLLRCSAMDELDARVTLMDVAQRLFGAPNISSFDIAQAQLIFAFGADFTESWLAPAAHASGPGAVDRQYLVQFASHRFHSHLPIAEWVRIAPRSEGWMALALGRVAAETSSGGVPPGLDIDLERAAQETEVSIAEIHRLGRAFSSARRKMAIPGRISLSHDNGLAVGRAILALNLLAGNLGQPGGLFFTPHFPLHPGLAQRPASTAELRALIARMQSGEIKVLFVHGIDPVGELPSDWGFQSALQKVERVISFASIADETTAQADYVFPDHAALESWGYQAIYSSSDRLAVSGMQPVVPPRLHTRATADVLLAAAQAAGGGLPYIDEVDFIQQSLAVLNRVFGPEGGDDPSQFFEQFRQRGGWWPDEPGIVIPAAVASLEQLYSLGVCS